MTLHCTSSHTRFQPSTSSRSISNADLFSLSNRSPSSPIKVAPYQPAHSLSRTLTTSTSTLPRTPSSPALVSLRFLRLLLVLPFYAVFFPIHFFNVCLLTPVSTLLLRPVASAYARLTLAILNRSQATSPLRPLPSASPSPTAHSSSSVHTSPKSSPSFPTPSVPKPSRALNQHAAPYRPSTIQLISRQTITSLSRPNPDQTLGLKTSLVLHPKSKPPRRSLFTDLPSDQTSNSPEHSPSYDKPLMTTDNFSNSRSHLPDLFSPDLPPNIGPVPGLILLLLLFMSCYTLLPGYYYYYYTSVLCYNPL